MDQEHCDASILNSGKENLRIGSAILAILSSSASIVGCFLILITFVCWKDFRTTTRSILVFISIADLLTATGYVVGSAVYLHFEIYKPREFSKTSDFTSNLNVSYTQACEWQSFVTTTSSIASFFWTTVLAFYLYMTIVFKMYMCVRRLMPLIHLVSWGVPLVLSIVAVTQAPKWLGPSLDDTSVSWCFVAYHHHSSSHFPYYVKELLLGKGWEIITYVLVIFFYTATKIFIELEKRRPLQFPAYASALTMDKKVLFIPMVFLLVRTWGTIRFFISWLLPSCKDHMHHCSCDNILYHPLLVYLQAVGDGAQGWGNAILFVFFSAQIRKRLTNTISDASWKLRSGTYRHHNDTTDYGTINPQQNDSPTMSLTANTPIIFYGSVSPKNVK